MSQYQVLSSLLPPPYKEEEMIKNHRLVTTDKKKAENYIVALLHAVEAPQSWAFGHHLTLYENGILVQHSPPKSPMPGLELYVDSTGART